MKNISYKAKPLKKQAAFSLIEILIYTAIVGTVTTFLGGVLVSVTKIQSRTSASVEVNQQLNFVLNNIQRLVGESSVVEIPSGAATSTLVLRMSPSSSDPTSIYLQNNTIYLKQGTGTTTPLTSDQIVVNKLEFLKTSQYPGHDSVQVDLTVSYNTQNPELSFSKTLSSAIARVSAATFDSDLVPGADNTYDIGLGITRWQDMSLSGNLMVGGNVGVGTDAPAVGLHLGTAASSHSLSASNDMIVSGKLEVNGFIYSDLGIDIGTAVGGYGILANGNIIIKSGAIGTQVDPVFITGGATDRAVIIGPGEDHNRDFGHGAQTNPTLFIHSVLSPTVNNTRWLSLKHTGTAGSAGYGLINTGSGDLILQPSGNVGIGTTNPSAKLDVNGTAQMTGFKMPTGASNNYVLTSDASGVGTWQTSGGGGGGGGGEGAVHGSGAANYVAKWTDSSNIGNSQIFDDGTKVGIGTAAPGAKFDVLGAVSATPITNGIVRIVGTGSNPATGSGGGLLFAQQDSAGAFQSYGSITGRRVNQAVNNLVDLDFNTGSPTDGVALATRMTITNAGKVGIGTTVPVFKLDVIEDNQARIGDTEIGSWPANPVYAYFGHQALDHSIPGNYAVLQSADGNTYINYASGKNLFFRENNSDKMIISNGNVGIGTTAPAAKLHVSAGDSSLAYFGPNSSWDGRLYVGASPNVSGAKTAQVISTDGNLHLDNANAKTMYLNYYQSGDIRMNNGGGNVGIGTPGAPGYRLDVNGSAGLGQTYLKTSDIYFTDTAHNHTGIGNTTGYAAIENASNYNTLMILGRAGTGVGRSVSIWDYLTINGSANVTSSLTAGSLTVNGETRMNGNVGIGGVPFGNRKLGVREGMVAFEYLGDLINEKILSVYGKAWGGAAIMANNTAPTSGYGSSIGVQAYGMTYDFYANGPGANYGPFTGSHEVKFNSTFPTNPEKGLILSTTGETKIREDADGNITISSTLPTVMLANKRNDNAVLGVLVSENPLPRDHWYYEQYPNEMKTTDRFGAVNALGEGRVWVTNIYGDVKLGDYITTSEIAGYGAKQNDDLLHNYTVGKVIEKIDWDKISDFIEYSGVKYKKYLIAVVYTSG